MAVPDPRLTILHRTFAIKLVSTRVLFLQAGNGGDGSFSLASVFRVEMAGPDGGCGGNGGHVIFRASARVSSLGHIK